MAQTRRDVIKKAAVGGGVLWAAPAITTYGRVHAQAGSPPPTLCDCDADAFALSASGLVTIAPVRGSVASVDVGVISAGVLESSVDSGPACSAQASVSSLSVGLGAVSLVAQTLSSSANAPCDCQGGGATSSVASVTVGGSPIMVGATPNQVVNLNVGFPTVTIVINEQFCDGNQAVARALRITVTTPGVTQTIIVAESRAGNDVCTCTCCPPALSP